jgi:hypothetical protein
VSLQVLQLFVKAFGRANHEVATICERLLEVFGDDLFGSVVEVDHDISEEDTVVASSGRFVNEVVSLVADEFSERGADLNQSFGGVAFDCLAGCVVDRLKVFCL